MKQQSFLLNLWLISTVSIFSTVIAFPSWSQETKARSLDSQDSLHSYKLNHSSLPASTLISQSQSQSPSSSSPVESTIKVIAVELFENDGKLEVVLKTSNAGLLKPKTTTVDNKIVVDIPNAVLELKNGQSSFEFANPLKGITQFTAKNIQNNSIRVEITGENGAPQTTVNGASQELILAVSPPQQTQSQPSPPPDSTAQNPTTENNTPAELIKVTAVELFENDGKFEVVLKTSDAQLLKPTTTTEDNKIVADIPNAVLELTNGKSSFEFANPFKGITQVTAKNLENNSIRVEIIGEKEAPKATVDAKSQELVLAVSPPQTADSQTTEDNTAQTPPSTTPPQTPSSPTPQESDDTIEIVVTGTGETYNITDSSVGTRTETPIINVPQSVQIIPKQVIEEQGSTTVGDTLKNTAGVSTGRSSSDAPTILPVIRGFESKNTLRNGLRDTTLGTFAGTPNLERVEILRGPSSVLFGQGDPGGTVNVVTKQPLNTPRYVIEYQTGQFNLNRPSIDFTSPFDINKPEKGGYRLTGSYEWSDSFRDFEERRSFFISPVVKLINTDKTQLTAEVEYGKYNTTGTAPELPALGTVLDNPNGEIDIRANLGEPTLAESETRATRIAYKLKHKFNENWAIANELLFAKTDVPYSTNIFPRSLQSDGRTLDRILLENPNTLTNLNINTNVLGKFKTGSVEHELLAGVEFSQDTIDDKIDLKVIGSIDIFNPEYSPESLAGLTIPLEDNKTTTDAVGFYLQDQISFSKNLILVLGGRFDIAKQKFDDRRSDTQDFDRQDEAFSPRVGVVYKPAENISLYGSYTRSFKPVAGRETSLDPNTNTLTLGDPFEPERSTQYEVGIKANLFNDKLSTTLSFFNLERTNVAEQAPNDPVGFQQTGKQRSQGIELNVVGEIAPGWNILTSYAFTDAEITEDDSFPEGNQLRNVPRHAASLWTTYKIQSGTLKGLGLGLGLFYVGEREGDLENTFSLPSYLRTDASIFYKRDRFSASLNFQNLFDVEYYQGSRSDLRVIPGAPLTVFGKVALEF